jgi:hypothetical protein
MPIAHLLESCLHGMAAEMATSSPPPSKEDELVPVRPGRWTMYALISLQGLPHCELAAASAHVPACCPETRGGSALLSPARLAFS